VITTSTLERRTNDYFEVQEKAIHRHADRLFAALMVGQWLFSIALALWISPMTWAGMSGSIHPHIWAAVFLGGLITAGPVCMVWQFPGEAITRHTIAVAQMLIGALLIHLTGGRIETHFHIFGSLAFLAFYRDWKVLVTASVVVMLDHFFRGTFWPQSVYGTISAPIWRTFEHGAWVIFEDVFLVISIKQSLLEMRKVARHEAELELVNANVEARVMQRTRELVASEARFRSLSSTAPVAIFQTDDQGKVVFTNRRWTEISGLSADETLGTGWLSAIHPEDRERIRVHWEVAAGLGSEFDREYRVALPSGAERWVHGRAKPYFSETGKFSGHVVAMQDFTDRKRHEEELARARDAALESARLKSEFLANMSHEIRTPLNAVLGMTGLLLNSPLSDEQREFARTSRTSAESLLTVLNDILDFSKIEAGKLSFEEEDFDLRETLEDTLEMLAENAQAKGLELVGFLMPGVAIQIRGDAGRLRQVLLNLVGNAVKFTEYGEVIVRISGQPSEPGEIRLRFEIEDTGIGIPAGSQDRLFQAFTQIDGSTTRRHGGTGLGLVISRRLVEMMHGQIGMSSEVGRGSLFWFTAAFKPARAPFAATPSPLEKLDDVKVLVVDDNASNRLVLHHQLAECKMRDVHAANAAEALELLRRHAAAADPFQVAILDMQMPEMDGLQLARAMEAEPATRSIPKIILTSLGSRIPSNAMREAGIVEWLLKPVRQKKLFDSLARALHGSAGSGAVHGGESSDPVQKESGETLRILLAEDNQVNQKVILFQLRKLGYQANVASNGVEALRALERSGYDVVLMDCQMPEMEGYEATRRIREREKNHTAPQRRVHIIALTANAMEGDREKCLAAGMDDYLSKPLRLEDLAAALERTRAALRSAE